MSVKSTLFRWSVIDEPEDGSRRPYVGLRNVTKTTAEIQAWLSLHRGRVCTPVRTKDLQREMATRQRLWEEMHETSEERGGREIARLGWLAEGLL